MKFRRAPFAMVAIVAGDGRRVSRPDSPGRDGGCGEHPRTCHTRGEEWRDAHRHDARLQRRRRHPVREHSVQGQHLPRSVVDARSRGDQVVRHHHAGHGRHDAELERPADPALDDVQHSGDDHEARRRHDDAARRSPYGPNTRGRDQPYLGPRTPPGPKHRYHFQVFALDTVLAADAFATYATLAAAMDGHVLASGEVVGLGRAM